jgi:hypothetical protein
LIYFHTNLKILKIFQYLFFIVITSRSLPSVIVIFTITVILAAIATVLSQNNASRDAYDFQIEYGLEVNNINLPKEKNIFDFLNFHLNPIALDPQGKSVRSKQASNKQINFTIPKEEIMVKSPAKFIFTKEISHSASTQKTEPISEINSIQYQAIKNNNSNNCATIGNTQSAMDCRDEVYFQRAIYEKNIQLCKKIININLKNRCEIYLKLNLEDRDEV